MTCIWDTYIYVSGLLYVEKVVKWTENIQHT